MQLSDAWIETIAEHGSDRTSWTVRLGGKTLSAGATRRDPSGVRACEEARAWAQQHAQGVAFMWKHRRDAAGGIGSSLVD
ncbi:MAG TPA: hypothetical protein VM261_19600 [Kofleriaceae bacterium]|nr:hypothetical protein [Kofleriaceae bacterium]